MTLEEVQRDYAIRTIENYKSAIENVEHEFTFVTGALLSVLSALLPDRESNIVELDKGYDLLPYYDPDVYSDIEDYLYDIRNGLAHKIDKNYMDLSIDKRINQIQLNTDKNRIIRFNFNDFEKLLNYFEKVLKKQ